MGQKDVEPVKSFTEEESQDLGGSLQGLRERAEEHARKTINWYLEARRPKKRCARYTRAGAVTFVGIAGIIPVLSQMDGLSWLNPAFSTIALGIATLMVAYDRFFGCSSAWMRYIATEHEIRQALHQFQYDIEGFRLQWSSGQPNPEQTKAYLDRARAFILKVDGLIIAETNLWLAEFRDVLETIDTAIRERKTRVPEAAEGEAAGPAAAMAGQGTQVHLGPAAASGDGKGRSSSPAAIQ